MSLMLLWVCVKRFLIFMLNFDNDTGKCDGNINDGGYFKRVGGSRVILAQNTLDPYYIKFLRVWSEL